MTASGAAVGTTAVLPGLGTIAALSAAAGETAVFLEATAFYALAIASVYGVATDERERRRARELGGAVITVGSQNVKSGTPAHQSGPPADD